MVRILKDIPGQVCQKDNVLVLGKHRAEHDSRLRKGLRYLQDAGFSLNAERGEFSKTRASVLDHVLDSHGIPADPEDTEALTRMSVLKNAAELRLLIY